MDWDSGGCFFVVVGVFGWLLGWFLWVCFGYFLVVEVVGDFVWFCFCFVFCLFGLGLVDFGLFLLWWYFFKERILCVLQRKAYIL